MADDVLRRVASVGRFLRYAFHAETLGLVEHFGRFHLYCSRVKMEAFFGSAHRNPKRERGIWLDAPVTIIFARSGVTGCF